jgi:hypothetical protein
MTKNARFFAAFARRIYHFASNQKTNQTQFPAGYATQIRLLNYKIQQGKRKSIRTH